VLDSTISPKKKKKRSGSRSLSKEISEMKQPLRIIDSGISELLAKEVIYLDI